MRIPRKLKKKLKKAHWINMPMRVVYSEPVGDWYDVKAFNEFKEFIDGLQGMKRLGRYANNPDYSSKPPTEEDFDNMIKRLNEKQNPS